LGPSSIPAIGHPELRRSFVFGHNGHPLGDRSLLTRRPAMATKIQGSFNLLAIIYLIVGIFIAWTHDYINFDLLRRVGSALLAIVLWVLVVIDIDLHIPG
jgi:hypothetical protein